MYTKEDLIFKKELKEYRSWNYTKSEWGWSKEKSYSIATVDGLYKSYTDSDGFSYWQDSSVTLGSRSYDYFFITVDFPYVEKYQEQAVSVLNRLIDG